MIVLWKDRSNEPVEDLESDRSTGSDLVAADFPDPAAASRGCPLGPGTVEADPTSEKEPNTGVLPLLGPNGQNYPKETILSHFGNWRPKRNSSTTEQI